MRTLLPSGGNILLVGNGANIVGNVCMCMRFLALIDLRRFVLDNLVHVVNDSKQPEGVFSTLG